MNFKQATDALLEAVTLEDLAKYNGGFSSGASAG